MLNRSVLTGGSLLVALSIFACAQPSSAQSLEGVWRIVERTDSEFPQNTGTGRISLFVLTEKHYAVLVVQSNQPLPQVEVATPGAPTDAEKLALYERMNLFAANGGTYEFDGTTLVRTPTVSSGGIGTLTTKIEFEGNDTMWQITSLANSGERRAKYERLE